MCIRDRYVVDPGPAESLGDVSWVREAKATGKIKALVYQGCLLYTSDAADERSSVDLGGRRIIKKKKKAETHRRLPQNYKTMHSDSINILTY